MGYTVPRRERARARQELDDTAVRAAGGGEAAVAVLRGRRGQRSKRGEGGGSAVCEEGEGSGALLRQGGGEVLRLGGLGGYT